MNRQRGLPSYPGSRKLYIIIGFLTIIEALSITAQAIFLARAVTSFFNGAPLQEVSQDIGFFLLAFLSRHALTLYKQFLAERFAEKMGHELREKLIEAYFQQGKYFSSLYGTGRLVTLAIEGIDQLKEYIEIVVPRMIGTAIIPTLIVLYVFTVDLPSAIILIVTVPIIIIFMILLGLAAEKMADRQYKSYRVLSNHFIDSLKGLETLKYLRQSKRHEKNIQRTSKKYRQATMKTLRVAFLSSFALDFFTSLSIAFVAVGLGFRLIDGVITLYPALTILILAPEYFLPIRQVGSDYHATLDGQVALREVNKIIDEQKGETTSTITSLPPIDATVKLQLSHISVSYEEKQVLKDVSLHVEGPGMIGIVGESGAGKSTLIHLLAGLLSPSQGEIFINEKKIPSFQQKEWLEKIAYIPQHPYIFPLSLADNIRFYEPGATDEEVEAIVYQIGLGDFVRSLPHGIHERIGEGGRSLSGGQEQRIAIARALLSKREIILLDEPTAHLDIETEYEIKQLIVKLFANRLVFFATHRLHWMRQMDDLYVLKKGQIIEHGHREELLRNKGEYFMLEKITKEWRR